MSVLQNNFFKKVSPFIVAFASVAVLGGCGGDRIGPEAKDDTLKGSTTQEAVFNGGPVQNHTTLSAQFLKAKETYNFEGKLSLKGDIADNVTLKIKNGKLAVDGNVGNGVKIVVDMPMASHTETKKYSGYCYGYDFMSGKYEYSYKFNNRCSKTETIIDGFLYNDSEPAVSINGTVGKDVSINTYGKVEINGKPAYNQNQFALTR